MTIEVQAFGRDDADRWNALVERSSQETPFHRFECLTVLADHSETDLHAFVGFKGQEPVGLFPVFEARKGPVTAMFSPPPDLKVSYLGPALVNAAKLKPGKAERRHRRFVDAVLDRLDDASPQYVHVRTGIGYDDHRPFVWQGFEATPRFTYVVDLEPGPDALLDRFSRDARKNVRDARDADCVIREGGTDAVRTIIEQVQARHEEQDEFYGVTTDFVADLYESLPDGTVRPYVCEVGGRVAGGSVVLEDGSTAYAWQGVVKPDVDVDVNDVVHWSVVRDAADRGIDRYDLVGANNPRLSRYKAKFAPSLETYQSLERASAGLGLAATAYDHLR